MTCDPAPTPGLTRLRPPTGRPACARCGKPVAGLPEFLGGRYTQPVHKGCLAAVLVPRRPAPGGNS